MVERVIVVNITSKSSGMVLRNDLQASLKGALELEFHDSGTWWLTVKTGLVQIRSEDQIINTDNTFFFIRSRKSSSSLLSIICHVLKLSGIPFTDPANEYHTNFSNKSFAIPRLALHGLPVPDTIVVQYKTLRRNIEHIETHFNYPCVIKGGGSKGDSVFLVQSKDELLEIAKKIYEKDKSIITIQEMIENTYDVRALFFGTTYMGAMKRVRSNDEPFLNNISMGASGMKDELSDVELSLCRRACEVSYLDFCGVDFIRTPDGIKFLEINKSPQMDGFRKVHPDVSVGEALQTFIQEHHLGKKVSG